MGVYGVFARVLVRLVFNGLNSHKIKTRIDAVKDATRFHLRFRYQSVSGQHIIGSGTSSLSGLLLSSIVDAFDAVHRKSVD